jgi:hypothetical protein
MSASLSATVIVMCVVSTISARPELLELEELLALPRLPAELDDAPEPLPDPDPEPDELDDDVDPDPAELDPDPPDTGSPGLRSDSDTIVPDAGATSRVSASVVCALCKLASAPSTEACAAAIAVGEGVGEVVVVVELVGLGVVAVGVRFGVAVGVRLGVAVGVRLGVAVGVRSGVVVDVTLGFVDLVSPTRAATNSADEPTVVPALVAVPAVPEPDDPELPEPADPEPLDALGFSAAVS